MTNLNVPGLGTFADVAAYVDGVGNAARIAARALARADTAAKNAALTEMAEAIRQPLAYQAGCYVDPAARRKSDNNAHWPRWI